MWHPDKTQTIEIMRSRAMNKRNKTLTISNSQITWIQNLKLKPLTSCKAEKTRSIRTLMMMRWTTLNIKKVLLNQKGSIRSMTKRWGLMCMMQRNRVQVVVTNLTMLNLQFLIKIKLKWKMMQKNLKSNRLLLKTKVLNKAKPKRGNTKVIENQIQVNMVMRSKWNKLLIYSIRKLMQNWVKLVRIICTLKMVFDCFNKQYKRLTSILDAFRFQ